MANFGVLQLVQEDRLDDFAELLSLPWLWLTGTAEEEKRLRVRRKGRVGSHCTWHRLVPSQV